MNSSVDHKCQRCGSQYHGQICPFCTITGLDVNALLAAEGITIAGLAAPIEDASVDDVGQIMLVDVVSNRTYPVSTPVCRFGRDITNDIVLTGDKSLSRFHFQVTLLNDEYFVEDAGSRNGTFLNGSPVNAPKKVLNGDIISAGMSRYRFVLSADGQAPVEAVHQIEQLPVEVAPAANSDPMGTTGDMGDLPRKFRELQESLHTETNHNQQDPADKLYEEGQALMSNSQDDEDRQYQYDQSGTGNFAPAGQYMTPEIALAQPTYNEPGCEYGNGHPGAEQPAAPAARVDELFQEQLRAMQAMGANQGEPTPLIPAADACQQRQWPEWCQSFRFKELDDMEEQITALEELLSTKKIELQELRERVAGAEFIKNSLLATKDQELIATCSQVFQLLGWETAANGSANNELVLSRNNTAEAIVKIVSTSGQPKPQELGNLVGSLSTFWSEHGVEPKGVLIVSMSTDGPPEERPSLSQDYSDYASKKNVCLMSSLQLLSMYRQATLQGEDLEAITEAILGGSGQLSGYDLTDDSANS